MDPTIKHAWTQVLRDNPQRQGQMFLAAIGPGGTERRCCLGELCELAVRAGIIGRREIDDDNPDGDGLYPRPDRIVLYGTAGDESRCALPDRVLRWAGLDEIDPAIAPELPASAANDTVRMTFPQIADAIDNYL